MDESAAQDRSVSPILASHIAAGTLAILAGATAACAPKGSSLHRKSGDVFSGAMAIMSALGVVLAFTTPQVAMSTPPEASASVGFLTAYLVATGWLAGRTRGDLTARYEVLACSAAAALALVLIVLAMEAVTGSAAMRMKAAPYFVFAGLSTFAATVDLRWLAQGATLTPPRRLGRHLWRMCSAFFFATSFFFIGQQKAFPTFLHGSPVLLGLGFAPLALMIVWLLRMRLTTTRSRSTVSAS